MEIAENGIVETIEPSKNANDTNEYRIIVLENGLKALLISTPLNIYGIDENKASTRGHYSAEEGPHFLRHGATARGKNYASEVFSSNKPTRNKKPKNEIQSQDVEMAATSCRTDQEDEVLASSSSKDSDSTKEDGTSDTFSYTESDESADDEDVIWDEEDEFFDKLLSGDARTVEEFLLRSQNNDNMVQLASEYFGNNVDTPMEEMGSCTETAIDAVSIGAEMIPLDVSDMERWKDEVGKLILPDSQTKTARNGVISITFPVGSLSDCSPLSLIGIADLSRQVVQDGPVISVNTGYETTMTTFTHLCEIKEDVDSCFKNLLATIESTNDIRKKISFLTQSNYPNGNSVCEIKNSLDRDSWMLSDKKQLHLLYSLSKENHPFKYVSPDFYLGLSKHKLPQMSEELFVEDLNRTLSDACIREFCISKATIVIQSSESLACLESIMRKHVGEKKCGHPPMEHEKGILESPFDMETFAQLYQVVYTGAERLEPSLVMSWALSPDLWKNYKSRPMDYVSWMISHKNQGGLHATLFETGSIIDIQAGCNHTGYHRNNYITLFQIKITMTEWAMTTPGVIRMVVKAVFSYLNFLKDIDFQCEIFEALLFSRQIIWNQLEPESDSLRNLQIPFSHSECPLPKISVLGERMQMIPEEDLPDLLSMDTLFECSPVDVDIVLTSLDFDACNFMLSNKSYGVQLEHQELYYGTKYQVKSIPPMWKEVEAQDKDLPAKFFVPIVHKSIKNLFGHSAMVFDNEDIEPISVLETEHVNVWKKCNANFKTVSAYIMHFASPLLNVYSPNRAAMISILSQKLNEQVVHELDALKLTCLHYSIEPTHIGILVKIFGHPNQSTYALEFILDRYKEILAQNSQIPQIQSIANKLQNNYKTALARSEILARCVYNNLSVRNYVPLKMRLNALQDLTDDSYSKELELFQQSFKTGMLAIGCCTLVKTLELASKLPESSSADLVKIAGQTRIFSYEWPVDNKIIRVVNEDMEKDNIRVSHHYQLGIATPKNKAFAYILTEIFKKEIHDNRNERQRILIDARVNEFNSVIDFELIGSASNTPIVDEVEDCLEHLMDVISGFIEDSQECFKIEFSDATNSLVINRSSCGKSHNSINNELHAYERKIKDFTFAFRNVCVESVYAHSGRKEFSDWFVANFVENVKKISIQIVPPMPVCLNEKKRSREKKAREEIICSPTTGYTLVKPAPRHRKSKQFIYDLENFKGSLNLYPPCAFI